MKKIVDALDLIEGHDWKEKITYLYLIIGHV